MRVAIHRQSREPLSDSDGVVMVWATTDDVYRWLEAHDAASGYWVKPARMATGLEMAEVAAIEDRNRRASRGR